MLNFQREPFCYLPFGDNDLFDLTCEYCISQIEKIQANYHEIAGMSQTILNNMPNSDFDLYKICFGQTENYLENYAKLVKSVNLSIGQPVGRVASKQTILDYTNYNPSAVLQEIIVHGLRNTSQHFEERLQDYQNQVDPFLKLYYNGQHIYWEITFGKGGYRHSGNRRSWTPESFEIDRLSFQSYRIVQGVLTTETVSIQEIWNDTNEIFQLFENNIEIMRQQKGLCCPPIRGLSIFTLPDKPE